MFENKNTTNFLISNIAIDASRDLLIESTIRCHFYQPARSAAGSGI